VVEQVEAPWRLRVYPFELKHPSGWPIHLASAKVEALLAILAARPGPILRTEIEATLWPDSPAESRQVNLRQALYRLRSSIGHEAIVTGRRHCELAGWFDLVIDRTVLPNHDHVTVTKAGASFLNALTKWSTNDAGQMLDLMRSNLDLVLGLPPRDLAALLEAASAQGDHLAFKGWLDFLKGFASYCGNEIRKAQPLLLSSVKHGVDNQDVVLATEGLFWLALSHQFLNRSDLSAKAESFMTGYVGSLGNSMLSGKLAFLRGLLMMHSGNGPEGIESLTSAGICFDSCEVDRAQYEALIAMFRASAGETVAAARLLEWPTRVAVKSGHYRLQATCDLARGYIALHEHQNALAVSLMFGLAESAAGARAAHMEIYGREGAAVALWRLGDRATAAEQLAAAQALRSKITMGYTEWDRSRLRGVVPQVLSA
jgi:hypothetical protein